MTKMSERVLSTAAALLLQAGFLLLLFQAIETARPARQILSRELTLLLPRLPVKRPAAAPALSRPSILTAIRPLVAPPAQTQTPLFAIPAVPPASLQGFGQALNNCAPENYANLPEDQKALCTRPGQGVAVQSAPNLMGSPSQVKDEAHWQAEFAREQSATLLPCGGFINVACLLGKIFDGSLADYGDPRTWPTYETKRLQPEDFYKIQQAYDDWHAAHPAK